MRKLYDSQNILLNRNKSRECFSFKLSHYNIISMHSICFYTGTGETNMMRKFIPFEFLQTFTKGDLSVDIHASILQSGNDTYDGIVVSLEEIGDLFHSEVRWTVYGWRKRGFINDNSLLGNYTNETGDNNFPSQDISTHVVHLQPPKKEYLDLSTISGRSLDNLKFEFSTL